MKKVLSLCMICMMLLALVPLTTFADGEAAETPPVDADGYYLLDSSEDVTLEAGDKIFLWENLKTLRPLCGALTVNK